MMTLQEIFDKVAAHLLTQKKQSLDAEDMLCQYRGHSGMMCAVGCLIPDKFYDSEMEGKVASEIPYYFGMRDILPNTTASHALLIALQNVHDRTHEDVWKPNLASVAATFSLNPWILEKFV